MARPVEERMCSMLESKQFYKYQPWLVCLSAALFFFYEFIQMSMFNSISQELIQCFSINASQLGFLSATYFYADVIFLLFAGILVDRVSIRTIVLSAMCMVICATILFAFSYSFRLAGFCHFVAGIGNAFCFLSCIKLATRWFPSHRLAFVISIIIAVAMLGGVVAQMPFTFLVQWLGWRHAVLVNAGLGMIITFIIYLFIRDYPEKQTSQIDSKQSIKPTSFKKNLLIVLSNKQNGLGGAYTCLLNLPVILLGELWGVMYLMQAHHLLKPQASLVASMIFIGTIIGLPFTGWISDKIGKRRLPMIIGALLSFLTLFCIMFLTHLTFYTLLILFLLLGIFTSTQIISYPLIVESNPPHLTGMSTGLASIFIMGGAAVFQPLFGWLMDLQWNHQLDHGIALYSPSNYLNGLAMMLIACMVCVVVAYFLRETHCQPSFEETL